ncbi:MAG: hypothetical protein L3J33_03620 [Rhodobacteraceae bacterium]|nr:hypothetical protein [Paracoccaceae bacterium]
MDVFIILFSTAGQRGDVIKPLESPFYMGLAQITVDRILRMPNVQAIQSALEGGFEKDNTGVYAPETGGKNETYFICWRSCAGA